MKCENCKAWQQFEKCPYTWRDYHDPVFETCPCFWESIKDQKVTLPDIDILANNPYLNKTRNPIPEPKTNHKRR
jgi:hypothetical protein